MNKISKNLVSEVINFAIEDLSYKDKRLIKTFFQYSLDYILNSTGYIVDNNGSDCLEYNHILPLPGRITSKYSFESHDILKLSKQFVGDNYIINLIWNHDYAFNINFSDSEIVYYIIYDDIVEKFVYDFEKLESFVYKNNALVYQAYLTPMGIYKSKGEQYGYFQSVPPVKSLVKSKLCYMEKFENAIDHLHNKSQNVISSK